MITAERCAIEDDDTTTIVYQLDEIHCSDADYPNEYWYETQWIGEDGGLYLYDDVNHGKLIAKYQPRDVVPKPISHGIGMRRYEWRDAVMFYIVLFDNEIVHANGIAFCLEQWAKYYYPDFCFHNDSTSCLVFADYVRERGHEELADRISHYLQES